jgi:opacity protein-like surface antigen
MKIQSTIQRRLAIAGFACAIVLSPQLARADGFVTPFIGPNFSGSTNTTLATATEDNSKLAYGVSLGWMSAGVIGLEADLGYAPKFFAPGVAIGQTNVLTLTGNLIVGIPIGGQHGGGVRPYVVGGVGLLRTNAQRSIATIVPDRNSFGFDLGGGINGYFSDHIGIRGDARYFRDFTVSDSNNAIGIILGRGKLDFWRGTVGVVFRF